MIIPFTPLALSSGKTTDKIVAVSLNYTNHLIDIPQVHTYVNAYGENRENIRAAIEKICGKSEFKGNANETVFCGREDTRY